MFGRPCRYICTSMPCSEANCGGLGSGLTVHDGEARPERSRSALTAARPLCVAPSIVARSTSVRAKSPAMNRFSMAVQACGRSSHEPTVLMNSGSALLAVRVRPGL